MNYQITFRRGIEDFVESMHESGIFMAHFKSAMEAGLNENNCRIAFPICAEMKGPGGSIRYPPILLQNLHEFVNF